jgi:membrane protein implicated in regulation of membrane protease activity
LLEFMLGLGLLEKFFLTCALSGTVVFAIRMILMFSGMLGSSDGELEGGGHDAPHEIGHDVSDVHDLHDVAEIHDDVSHDLALDDGDGIGHQDLNNSDISFQFVSVQGLTAFFMMFGWVGLALVYESGFPGWVATIGGAAAGVLTVWVLAQMFRFASSLQCDGTMRVKRALGAGGTVYLRIPAEGSGQVQVEIDGRLDVRDAISASKEEIKTGEQVTVVWVQDNGVLIVEKDKREAGGKLCGR